MSMSSATPTPSDPARRRGQLRRAIHILTTSIRERTDASNRPALTAAAEPFPSNDPSTPSAHVVQQPLPLRDATHPPEHQNTPSPPLSSNDLDIATVSTTTAHPSLLDPSNFTGATTPAPGEWTLDRASAHASLAQRLTSRYGISIQPHDYLSPSQPTVVRRVQRVPRMRAQQVCHQCGSEFGSRKRCQCGHEVCKRCPKVGGRSARSKSEDAGVSGAVAEVEMVGRLGREIGPLTIRDGNVLAAGPSLAEMSCSSFEDGGRMDEKNVELSNGKLPLVVEETSHLKDPQAEPDLHNETHLPHGRPRSHLAARPRPRERRSRTHITQIPVLGACRALRLHQATDEPQNSIQYPGFVQRVYRKPRQRIRHLCHLCTTTLPYSSICSTCGHSRCRLCRRSPPIKERITPDAKYIEAVERRLAAVRVGFSRAAVPPCVASGE